MARRAAGDVDAEVQSSSATLGEHAGGRLRQHEAEFVPERLLGVADLEARDGVQLGGGTVGAVATGGAAGGHAGFAAGEDGRTGDGGDEGLVGADVGRCLILTDVLFARGEHHHDAISAGVVLGLADETTGGFADLVFAFGVVADGEDAEAGAAEVGADGEVLAFTDEDVRALASIVCWCLEAAGGEEHRVDDRNRLHAGVGAGVRQLIGVFDEAEVIDLGEDDGGDLAAVRGDAGLDGGAPDPAGCFFGREELELDGSLRAMGAEDFEVAGEEVGRDEDGVGLGHADGADGGFEERAGAVVEGGVDGFEAGQLGERRLVDPVRDERALGALGLVGRVGRCQVTDRADMPDDFMGAVNLQAIAEEAGLGIVTLGERQHAVGEGGVFEFVRQVQLARELHVVGDMRVHVAELRRTNGLEHRLDVGLARRDIVPGELARNFGRIVGQLGHERVGVFFEGGRRPRNRPPWRGGGISGRWFSH